MGGLVGRFQDFVCVLVGHLVLQDLDHAAPLGVEHEVARHLDATHVVVPAAQQAAAVDQAHHRRSHRFFEVSVVDLAPGAQQLPKQ